jgi:hypothetical protein
MTGVKELPTVKIELGNHSTGPDIYIDGGYLKGVYNFEVFPEEDHTKIKITITTSNLSIIQKVENITQVKRLL